MKITLENRPKNKQIIVSEVLKDLPEWFGMDDFIAEYIENSAIYRLYNYQVLQHNIERISQKSYITLNFATKP